MILRISLIIILLAIAYLSLTPSSTISIGTDKVGHFLAYGVLMINIGLLTVKVRKHYVFGIAFALFYGILMEFGQYFVPGRFVSIADVLANTSGVVLGVLVTSLLSKQIFTLLKRAGIK